MVPSKKKKKFSTVKVNVAGGFTGSYCAGISKSHYTVLCDKAIYFLCLSGLFTIDKYGYSADPIRIEIMSLKSEIAELKDAADKGMHILQCMSTNVALGMQLIVSRGKWENFNL